MGLKVGTCDCNSDCEYPYDEKILDAALAVGAGFKRNPSAPLPYHFAGLYTGEALVCPFGDHEKRLKAHSGTRWKLPPDRTQRHPRSRRGAIGRTC